MKKLVLLLLVMMQTLVVMADDSGKCGKNVKWKYTVSTKTLTIVGKGAMDDYISSSRVPWSSYSFIIKTVIIKYGVTSIGDEAFSYCPNLTSITIPKSVTRIGKDAFQQCTRLTSITIPNSIRSIGDYAFLFCSGLTSVIIPNSVTSIGNGAFSYCSSLTSITIPNSVTSIGDEAFHECKSLTYITIPNGVTSIGNSAFSRCYNLTSVTIPNSVTSIGVYTFAQCTALTSITIPNSVTSIAEGAFYNCKALTSVTIPNSIKNIGSNAFPSTTKIIRGEAMAAVPSLTNKQPVKINQIPNLVVVPNSIAFVDAAGANAIVGGKNSTITLKVQNIGKGIAYNCLARVSATGSSQGIKANNVTLSSIAAGETKTIELPITAGMNTQDGQVEFAIQVDEPNGFGTDPHYLTVQTKAFEAPLVKITDYSLTGNAGSTLKKKQPFDLQLMLQNTNYGQADNVSVSIDIPQNVLLFDGSQQQSFASLKGGETKSLVYSLIVNNNYQDSTIPIKVHVREKYGKYAEDRTINLTLDQALASTKIDVKASQQQPRQSIAIASIGSDVDKEIPTSAETQQKTFVVIIANEHYQTVDGVPYANNDGAIFENYCRQTLGIPQKNIRIVKDATLNGMKYQIGWLKKVMMAYHGEASAIVYYAGHGIPDEQSLNAYLLPTDGYTGSVSSAYSLEEFYRTLSELPAQSVTVFLDACFSGTKRDGSVLANARGVAIKAKTTKPQGNMIVFSAAQGDETAYPYNEQGHGMFTYYLLKKLKESKGNATLGDLSDYIIQEVSRQSIVENSKSQTPTVTASPTLQSSWRNMKLK